MNKNYRNTQFYGMKKKKSFKKKNTDLAFLFFCYTTRMLLKRFSLDEWIIHHKFYLFSRFSTIQIGFRITQHTNSRESGTSNTMVFQVFPRKMYVLLFLFTLPFYRFLSFRTFFKSFFLLRWFYLIRHLFCLGYYKLKAILYFIFHHFLFTDRKLV